MRRLISLCVVAALTGCSAETATTAATGAAIKKKEIEEGKRTQDQARQKIEKSMQQSQERAEKDGER